MRFRILLCALLSAVALTSWAAIPAAEQVTVVEFYHSGLDHYFITANPQEINDLDTGVHPGWVRTGYQFPAIKTGSTLAGTAPMCRFYAPSFSSHFYTAKAQECTDVQNKFPDTWLFESPEVFRAFPVDINGGCPADTTGVLRLWNQRSDVNHRYTVDIALFQFMVAKGYKPEGDGNPQFPLVYCVPTPGAVVPAPSASAPNCTVTASSGAPALGSTLSLNATCTNNPESFMWSGCNSIAASCTTTQSTAGSKSYTLYSSNSFGPGGPVTITANWGGSGGGGGATPICTISASSLVPTAGTNITLSQNCNNTPTKYNWEQCDYLIQTLCNAIPTCPTSASTCTVTNSTAAFARYAIEGENGAGKGPRAAVDVEWKSSGGGGGPPPGGDPIPSCTIIASNLTPMINNAIVLSASCSGNPLAYNWGGVACSAFQCSANSAVGGTQTYSLTASNAAGTSAPAYLSVDWQAGAPTPSCTLSSNNPSPTTGQTITITASCTNNPTSFAWGTNCTASGATCTDTNNNAGPKAYTLNATNAAGTGPTATLSLNWASPPTSKPVCSISASNTAPVINTNITLTATCTNSPAAYVWTNCVSTGPTCTATSAATGLLAYYVAATNQFGTGDLAGVNVNWQPVGGGGGDGGGADFCGSYNNVISATIPWGDFSRITTQNLGGFAADGVFVVQFTVPAAPASYANAGNASVVEYASQANLRQTTLSKARCDFRAPDPTGANGPLGLSYGVETSVPFNVGVAPLALVPGQTYYVNTRNYSPDSSGTTCSVAQCNAAFQVAWPQ